MALALTARFFRMVLLLTRTGFRSAGRLFFRSTFPLPTPALSIRVALLTAAFSASLELLPSWIGDDDRPECASVVLSEEGGASNRREGQTRSRVSSLISFADGAQ